ncbi:hypothetical protein H2248_002433 [Termitomyces sp. 'cryptogamus']|nr:hypothetical protein H2248_002433 [Termitomyces sp. 'cryptogamus']
MSENISLEYIINHVFLPPRLPQSGDLSMINDLALLDLVIGNARAFAGSMSSDCSSWSPIIEMLENLRNIYSFSALDRFILKDLFSQLTEGGTLVIPVRAQNACLFIRRMDVKTIYESFEVDPPNKQIMASTGGLIRRFPGLAFEITHTSASLAFQQEMMTFLADMDVVTVGSAPTIQKANSDVYEDRDTANPHFITELLTAIIYGSPDSRPADVERIVKRVRNEILYERNADMPWRRSPLWLIIRVALQTTLRRASSLDGQTEYKAFIIFLLSDIVLSNDNYRDLSNDILVCMQNKIVRRLRKLPDVASGSLFDRATEAISKAKEVLESRWKDIRNKQALSPLWSPGSLDVSQDTNISLLSSKDYLSSRLRQNTPPLAECIFEPSEIPRLSDEDFSTPEVVLKALSNDPFIALADVEEFSVDRLETWVDEHCSDGSACVALGECILHYATVAQEKYEGNPEEQSLMLLTVFLLWSAFDRLAVAQLPLLAEYSPEIAENILDPILLRGSKFIQSLIRLRSYLHKRHSQAYRGSVFDDNLSKSSFAIQYFCNSSSLMKLKTDIENAAQDERDKKREEFLELKDRYTQLINDEQSKEHDREWDRYGHSCHYIWSCCKCALQRNASNMTIQVHEWPLPTHELLAQATVFELQCPLVFQVWRSTTYTILFDICDPGITGTASSEVMELADDVGLKDHCKEQTRITYASPSRSFTKSHYSTQKISSIGDLSSILVENGLRYSLYDRKLHRWVTVLNSGVNSLCSFTLPSSSPYYSLQYATQGVTHSANQPLADQGEVSPELSLHKHIAFGILRSGAMLQWLNILRELRAQTLPFDRLEVHMLITQASLQTGNIKDGGLEWHEILKRSEFGLALISEIDNLLSSVESNWHHIVTLQTMIILITRLLASSPGEEVSHCACSTLRTARKIAFMWVTSLTDHLKCPANEAISILTRQRVYSAATACRATYDVDSRHFEHLITCDEDVTIFIQCAILMQDNMSADSVLELFLARDRRISRRLAPIIWDKINNSRAGLDDAILRIWKDYRRHCGSDWKSLPAPNERWLISDLSVNAKSTIHYKMIHYNLFNGTLLIDGKPLGRLPSSITGHPTYVRLLGDKILDVVPSRLRPNMAFATRDKIFARNCFLHFQLPTSDDSLIIQAEVEADIFELVPHQTFHKRGHDFPLSFITEYAHWLHLSPTSNLIHITFHPLRSIWRPSEDNWDLTFDPASSVATMKAGNGAVMVDVRSDTFGMISKPLERLVVPTQVHVTLGADGTLSADLPQYKLAFFVNQNKDLECTTIRDMVVDPDQSSGTMYGLANQLVLRSRFPYLTRIAVPGSRCVIIPFGNVTFRNHQHHSHVTISIESSQRYFTYHIDSTLGRLVGTTLLSDIYKIYLHACTSFPLPDDLTGCTGTEEAICQLESARCYSFQDLSAEEDMLLHNIANLTPGVEWFPKNLELMQTVHWKDISSLSQHWAFTFRVEDIFQFHGQLSSIGISTPRTSHSGVVCHLLTRLDSRTSGLYPPGSKNPSSYPDALCPPNSRDHENSRDIHLPVANISALSHHIPAQLNTVSNLWERLQKIQVLTNEAHAMDSYSQLISPTPTKLLLPLYEMCRQEQNSEASSSKMAFSLSTIVYTFPHGVDGVHDDQIQELVHTFLAFSRYPEFQTINLPPSTRFDFGCGFKPDKDVLTNLLMKYPLEPPGNRPERQIFESNDHYYDRRKVYLESMRRQQLQDITERLVQQWPCSAPTMPHQYSSDNFDLFDLRSSDLKDKISQYFLAWFNNMKFEEFIHQVQRVLNTTRMSSSDPPPISKFDPYRLPPLEKPQPKRLLSTTLDDLILCCEPRVSPISTPASAIKMGVEPSSLPAVSLVPDEVTKLDSLVKLFKEGPQALHREYGAALENSLTSYRQVRITEAVTVSQLQLSNKYELHRRKFDDIYRSLLESLAPKSPLEDVIHRAGHWPFLTTRALLNLLSKDKIGITTPSVWKTAVVTLAQRLVNLQRSRRALRLKILGREEELSKELDNVGYERDSAFQDPEWLLIQIDSDFTVRPVQTCIAQAMISPRSAHNSLTQLNMGEGKSAVIVPLVSSALADGEKLVRVVVLKSLANQMFDLLVRRLSGLANRRIFYLPFSRDFKPVPKYLENIHSLYEMCVRERGVLLIQPEHILSFRLMGIDLTVGTYTKAAECLLRSHRWLSSHSRDLLDESDEILRVTYQLVYTSGLQEPMENHPRRWTIIQEVIGHVLKHVNIIQSEYPDGLEAQSTEDSGSPVIRILDDEAGEALIESVATEVLFSDKFKLIPARNLPTALDFVRNRRSTDTALRSLRTFVHDSSTWKDLLLYRALLGHGLLRFVLQEKRWRVDYGLDLTRTLLAVPYRAKDLPALRADFGHPDVALLLTCLSYYYGGLTEEQLDQSFELLFRLDDPPLEYAEWVSGRKEIPSELRDIKGVNLDDEYQRKLLLGPLFRKNKTVVDFFLSSVVFPRYAKQFPKKLSTSSWDLSETKDQVTTGFSGTNDNRYLLPTSIQQDNTTAAGDSFGQLATNAKVLSILLRPENDTYCCLKGKDGHSPTGSDFLELLSKQTPPVRVLLDVGAQMLDMQNTELVSKWLLLVKALDAIVFFNDHDELVVMSRDGQIENFVTSPYSQKLDLCAVYLDDAHTRGTDLKLPINFRAVVTLGPKLTKDRLVQGE